MSVRELQNYTAVSKYARWLEDRKGRETWPEVVGRSREMMTGRFPDLAGEIDVAYAGVERMDYLGSQRLLQFGGYPAIKRHSRGFNCWGSYCDRLRFFGEMFYLLLCGGGTGYSIQRHHVERLPHISPARRSGRTLPRKRYTVPDTIEGWANSSLVLLSSYHEEPVRGYEDYHDCQVEFDYSLISPKGTLLSYGIGRTPGPDPLRLFHDNVRQLLDEVCRLGLDRMRPIDCLDYACHQSEAVLAGGIRRSATLSIFDLDDEECLAAKTGDWYVKNRHRSKANISALLLRGQTTWEQFSRLWEFTRQFGEPGLFWTFSRDCVCNPCAEVLWDPRWWLSQDDPWLEEVRATYQGPLYRAGDKVGLSGWGDCNLCTINGKTLRDKEDFWERCEQTAFLGTLQASLTDLDYLGPVTEKIVRHEALIGISINGLLHHPEITLNPDNLREGVRRVLNKNEETAKRIGINPAARTTLLKPEGNSSCLLGCEPGGNGAHAERYFRTVQANEMESPFLHFRAVNPRACEKSKWSANGTDYVIRFCVETPPGTIMKDDLTALDMLGQIHLLYENWVKPGTRPERSLQPHLSHNVSNTVPVRPHEWESVKEYVYSHQEGLGGVSFFGATGDLDYPQSPYTRVRTPEEQEQIYGRLAFEQASTFLIHSPFADPWDAASILLGWSAPTKWEPGQEEWLIKVREWAGDQWQGDLPKAVNCLKDCWLWRKWVDLKAEFRPVDYTHMVEAESSVDLRGEVACGGQGCLLV